MAIAENHYIPLSSKGIEVVFVLLGHEIVFPTHELSSSASMRCDLLASIISNLSSSKYAVLFMGKGRLQGDCLYSISDCMYTYFSAKYQSLQNAYLDQESLDTVGDAVYSKSYIDRIGTPSTINVITSDWHAPRVSHVFNAVFGTDRSKLAISTTNEMKHMPKCDLDRLLSHEQQSLDAFNSTFPDPESIFSWTTHIKEYHPLYK